MLHEQWKEQTFAAGASNNHHRTEGVRDKPAVGRTAMNGGYAIPTFATRPEKDKDRVAILSIQQNRYFHRLDHRCGR